MNMLLVFMDCLYHFLEGTLIKFLFFSWLMLLPAYNVLSPKPINFGILEFPEPELLGSDRSVLRGLHVLDARLQYGWDTVRAFYMEEKSILRQAAEQAQTHRDFETFLVAEKTRGEGLLVNYGPMELGVDTIVTALFAAGYAPVDACRGHPDTRAWHKVMHPQVYFFARHSEAHLMDDLVQDTSGVFLRNAFKDGFCLELYAADNMQLLEFAKKMADYFAPE